VKCGRFERVFDYPFYNEFLLKCKGNVSTLRGKLLENNFIPPLEISKFYKEERFKDVLLFAVTELLSREYLDQVTEILSE